ncbi:MAG: hypothetical protein JRG94_05785 [Deltaproteobacteria bacterium]|nr:hypothetical protein [Deltaproteobacteria bacterium]
MSDRQVALEGRREIATGLKLRGERFFLGAGQGRPNPPPLAKTASGFASKFEEEVIHCVAPCQPELTDN